MIETAKKDFTEEEFKELSKRVLPHLKTIQEIVDSYAGKDGKKVYTVYVHENGGVFFSAGGSGWQLYVGKSADGKRDRATIDYRKSEDLEV